MTKWPLSYLRTQLVQQCSLHLMICKRNLVRCLVLLRKSPLHRTKCNLLALQRLMIYRAKLFTWSEVGLALLIIYAELKIKFCRFKCSFVLVFALRDNRFLTFSLPPLPGDRISLNQHVPYTLEHAST